MPTRRGKLAETVPVRLADTPSYLDFPGEHSLVNGTARASTSATATTTRAILAVDYPFGHGISYTTFEYSDPVVTTFDVERPVAFTADITVTNTGSVQVLKWSSSTSVTTRNRHNTATETPRLHQVYLQPGQSERCVSPSRATISSPSASRPDPGSTKAARDRHDRVVVT